VGKSNPNGTLAYQKLYVDRVGMASSDCDNQRLVAAVHRFAGPTVNGMEVVVHSQE
jgi:hypothetical protein